MSRFHKTFGLDCFVLVLLKVFRINHKLKLIMASQASIITQINGFTATLKDVETAIKAIPPGTDASHGLVDAVGALGTQIGAVQAALPPATPLPTS